ncbi:FtsK/SpoIIIE family DNA translocase [Glacieibacterium megasporae]|uniref:FtsK/SpoIIIE family DNA translocase n=1 Tax=Glacieibacterium megasporae TaxID=2835787 RepID=UPI001C1E61C3|nr:DNA translocase FtsK 4TM domain-containing protein [Polymorphobacter megasporae]UAJ10838.1 DNA translocase FtsK 4TM domain-containing protein [Polymorphobacter megasporae]
MATRAATTGRGAQIVGAETRAALSRGVGIAGGIALLFVAAAIVAVLASYGPADPSFNTVTGRVPQNLLGAPGAWAADALLFAAGYMVVALVPALVVAGARLLRRKGLANWRRYALATLAGTLFAAGAVGALWPDPDAAMPAGSGGLAGLIAASVGDSLSSIAALSALPVTSLLALVLAMVALPLLLWGVGVDRSDAAAITGLFRHRDDDEIEPAAAPVERRRRPAPEATAAAIEQAAVPRATIVTPAAPPPLSAKRGRRDRQPTLGLGDIYELPPLDLLKPVPKGPVVKIDRAALEQNARLLESVLDDFGVKGRIGDVRPGPVVTMYELEPAPGLKASRVIGLSDDIARSMSAVSARVAVVPGRNVIGIELPNHNRQMVTLSELLASAAFEDQSAALPLVLGKNIAGDPVIADLSPMPHLLIAGTTGSGKSVGLNCMILSLLYRLSPDQCRMIMIDPKMLELSVYDRIPHLLSPVVTEPAKAIRALKWAVEQMEDRYRMMSTINVRSLSGFNQRVREAKASGKPFIRKVHTGYDDDGHAIYEEETLDFEPLPLIVVVVDELADLMMTAGKEVEFLIQRLAQKARAAGIHLIMATQRPSVDVITGVIKANLPTRISFSVTSKIDSRTILGEQGAEQLLGKGDMLYMPGGKQVVRVHGPFVSDEEVEAVADYCRTQGRPDYVDAVTEEPVEGDGVFGLDLGEGGGEEAETYKKAIMIVAESRKASTSYLQRQLRVGYNNAARLIERMEKDGYVGVADHVGRREVLIEPDGTRM